MMAGYRPGSIELTGMSVKAPTTHPGEFLLTVRAVDEEGRPIVAFSGGSTLGDAIVTLVNRIGNGSLKWKVDQYR
jgi:hypothetical protein